jgi:hypothetical protein
MKYTGVGHQGRHGGLAFPAKEEAPSMQDAWTGLFIFGNRRRPSNEKNIGHLGNLMMLKFWLNDRAGKVFH